VPELIVINKADAADPMVVARLTAREPHSVVVSARTGAGVDKLEAAIERDLPKPAVEVDVLVPYSRGDLVSRIHEQGEVASVEHLASGSRLRARVNRGLAAELEPYAAVVSLD
jgi:GTP-binding protein HflX